MVGCCGVCIVFVIVVRTGCVEVVLWLCFVVVELFCGFVVPVLFCGCVVLWLCCDCVVF